MKKTIKQHDRTDCGAACLASIAAHYRLGLPIARIRQLADTTSRGTSLLGLINAAEKLGLSAQGVRADDEALYNVNLPVIAHLKLKENSHHFVVIYRIGKRSVKVMDPATGRMEKWTRARFLEQWTGVLLLLSPGENFLEVDHRTSLFTRFGRLLFPHRRVLLQAVIGAVIYTVLGLATAIYLQKITDFVLISGNTELLSIMSIGMLALLALATFLGAMKSVMVLRTGQLIDANLILGYYQHLMRLPQRFFDNMRTGEIIARVGDAVKIRAFINDVAIALLVNVFIIIFSFGLMFTYYWKMAMALVVVIPLYLLTYWITNRINRRRERELMECSADLESQLVESINAARTIKQLCLEDSANRKTEHRFMRVLDATYRSGLNSVFAGTTAEVIGKVFTVLLLWGGTHLVIAGTISPGELLGFYALVGYFNGPARSLIGLNKRVQHALIAADRLFEIIDLAPEEHPEAAISFTKDTLGDIEFKNVCFGYGAGRSVFQHLSFTLPAGQVTGIVGESGSGKSTVAALLQKLYPLEGGKISIGDLDLNYFETGSLRGRIGVVPQQVDLFAGTLFDNIVLDQRPDLERVVTICRSLEMLSFIENLPQGFQTFIGEKGANLSGGQRQRIALARALYHEPDILILDEATAALDSISEAAVQRVVRQLRSEGKTIVIIAHRLSTVVESDQILVMQQGEVVQTGRHEELIGREGVYQHLWREQFPAAFQRRLVS